MLVGVGYELIALYFQILTIGYLFCQAYMALNDIDAAVESFKKALDLEPNDG